MKGLQHLIQFQKENIDSQSDQLSKLQKMVSHLFKTSVLTPLMFLLNEIYSFISFYQSEAMAWSL